VQKLVVGLIGHQPGIRALADGEYASHLGPGVYIPRWVVGSGQDYLLEYRKVEQCEGE
jgi:hypothetical protein